MSLAMVEYLCDVAIADIVQRHAPGKVWSEAPTTWNVEIVMISPASSDSRSVSPLLSQAVAIQQRRLRIETSYLDPGLGAF